MSLTAIILKRDSLFENKQKKWVQHMFSAPSFFELFSKLLKFIIYNDEDITNFIKTILLQRITILSRFILRTVMKKIVATLASVIKMCLYFREPM